MVDISLSYRWTNLSSIYHDSTLKELAKKLAIECTELTKMLIWTENTIYHLKLL
jgi:hypothetical protein